MKIQFAIMAASVLAGAPCFFFAGEAQAAEAERRAVYVPKDMEMARLLRDQAAASGRLAGTELAPNLKGSVELFGDSDGVAIWARADKLPDPRSLGPRNHAFVLWAVTPEGKAFNLGELAPREQGAAIETKTPLRHFGLMVSVEPNPATTYPGSAIYAKAVFPGPHAGQIDVSIVKPESLVRGAVFVYPKGGLPSPDMTIPRELAAARHAVERLRARRGTVPPSAYTPAELDLEDAEGHFRAGRRSEAIASARSAAQGAEAERLNLVRDESQALARAREKALIEERMSEEMVLAGLRSEVSDLRDALSDARSAPGEFEGLASVFFKPNSSELSVEMENRLRGVLSRAPEGKKLLVISGHADSSGPIELNRRLSLERAEAVEAFLLDEDIPQEWIEIRAYGEDLPAASNMDSQGRQQNRRVDVEIRAVED